MSVDYPFKVCVTEECFIDYHSNLIWKRKKLAFGIVGIVSLISLFGFLNTFSVLYIG